MTPECIEARQSQTFRTYFRRILDALCISKACRVPKVMWSTRLAFPSRRAIKSAQALPASWSKPVHRPHLPALKVSANSSASLATASKCSSSGCQSDLSGFVWNERNIEAWALRKLVCQIFLPWIGSH